ncbi:MAG TPA: hypothetical protein VGS58_09655 [Candidatus Sulfopaludibacter sp.]|nr:hypothetical protein [Candidatus Sulfopaludibacter sp.]
MALANLSKQNHCRSTILASATAGEGATTASVYLGRHLLRDLAFQPVLIELNRLRPSLARLFGLDDSRSLAAVAGGSRPVMECVQKDPEGLSMIPVGKFESSAGLKEIESALCRSVQELQNDFDFILVDAPPVLESSDMLMAGRVIPNAILVAGAGRASQESVREACRQLSEARIHVLGAILNERKPILPRWLRR